MEGGGIVRPLHNIKEDNNNKTRGKVDGGKEGQTQRGSKRIFVAGEFWSHRGVMCWTGFGPGKFCICLTGCHPRPVSLPSCHCLGWPSNAALMLYKWHMETN